MRTGWTETPRSSAAATAIGITISAVAMLLMSWPNVGRERNRPASRAYGPATRRRRRAARRRGPRRRSGSWPSRAGASRPRARPSSSDGPVGVLGRDAPGAGPSRPPPAGRRRPTGTIPVASRTTIAARTTIASRAPRPRGTTWRRTAPAASTTRTFGSPRFSSSAAHVPCSRSTSPTSSTVSPGPRSSPWRWMATMTRSPLSVTIPGKTGSPTRPERGGMTTSARPDRRRADGVRQVARVDAEPVLVDEGAGVAAEVARDDPGRARREEPLAEQHDDGDVPTTSGMPTSANSKKPNGGEAVVDGRLGDDDVHRRAGQRQHRTRVGPEHEGHEQLRRRAARAGRR